MICLNRKRYWHFNMSISCQVPNIKHYQWHIYVLIKYLLIVLSLYIFHLFVNILYWITYTHVLYVFVAEFWIFEVYISIFNKLDLNVRMVYNVVFFSVDFKIYSHQLQCYPALSFIKNLRFGRSTDNEFLKT